MESIKYNKLPLLGNAQRVEYIDIPNYNIPITENFTIITPGKIVIKGIKQNTNVDVVSKINVETVNKNISI